MGNYIKSEMFRLRKSKVLWGLMAFIVWYISASAINMSEGYFLGFINDCLIFPYILTVIIGLVVVDDGYKNKTIKNDLAYGISENKIWISKSIVGTIVGAIFFAIVDLVGIPLSFIFNKEHNTKEVLELLQSEGVMFVACVASLICFLTIFFITKKSVVAAIIWYVVAYGLNTVIAILDAEINGLYAMASRFVLSCAVADTDYIGDVYTLQWQEPEGMLYLIISSLVMIGTCIICKLVIKKKEQ